MFNQDEFMNFMGYRNMIVEEKIKECLLAVKRGETSINIDRGDLTTSEVAYVEKEVRRRIEKGIY